MSHVLYEGHEVAAWTLSLSFFVDTGSPVKVARVWLALVKPRLDRVDNIVVKNWLEIVLVLISLRRLVLVSQSTLVTCNRSIHVVILVLVVIGVSIGMEPLTINVIHLLFRIIKGYSCLMVNILRAHGNLLLLRIEVDVELLESLLVAGELRLKLLLCLSPHAL